MFAEMTNSPLRPSVEVETSAEGDEEFSLVNFSLNGLRLLSINDDGTLSFWQLTESERARLPGIQFDSEGRIKEHEESEDDEVHRRPRNSRNSKKPRSPNETR